MSPRPAETTPLSPASRRRLAVLWLAFCVVKIIGAVTQNHFESGVPIWKPLLWEGSSLAVVTVLAVIGIRRPWVWTDLHDDPMHWFLLRLRMLPVWCVVFVGATYGLRHGVYALVGETYAHPPWLQVFFYESVILTTYFILWLGVFFGIATWEHLVNEQLASKDAALALRNAHLALLQQQLKPHFLFNALNLVSATMWENVPKADDLLRRLAGLLRQTSAETLGSTHPLEDELALLGNYAEIMAARFEDRVEVVWRVAPDLPACRVPTMIAQPLLENAFKFGVEPFSAPSIIEIRVAAAGDRLSLAVSQNHGTRRPTAGSGQGLANVRDRLAAHYGARASLTLSDLEAEGVCARIDLPCGF